MGEIVLQSFRQGIAAQFDHTLIGLLARAGVKGQDECAVAAQGAQRRRFRVAVPAGQTAQGTVGGDLHHQQTQWSVRLDLQGQQAIEFDGRR